MSYWAAITKIYRVMCFVWKHYEALHDILESAKAVAKDPSKIDDLGAACDLVQNKSCCKADQCRNNGKNTP